MNRINLTKYGFVRSPEEDFSDDGNKFTCYRVGNVRVSKCIWEDNVFIAARWEDYKTFSYYDGYATLPHYGDMNRLNGVIRSSLTEEDLAEFYQSCVAYEREYKEALLNDRANVREII